MPAIEVSRLTKSFDYYEKEAGLRGSLKNLFNRKKLVKEAVRGISFEIEEGEIVGFLGANGAGKTTTLKMLSGILYPTGGSASVLGYTPWERKKEFKKSFSIVMGQKSQLWWDLPASESLLLNRYIYELDGRAFQNTVDELSELLGVRELLNVQVRRLSLGERMKMELIASLLHKPKIMFLDEPTIGLDIISQKKIREFIKHFNKETRTTVILTSHYMNDIEDLCRRSIIINEGNIVFDGELNRVNEVFSSKKLIKLQLSGPVCKTDLDAFGLVRSCDGLSATIEISKNETKQISKAVLDNLPVVDFNIEDIPVEEGITLLFQKGGAPDEMAL